MVCWKAAWELRSAWTIRPMKQFWSFLPKVWNFWKFETHAGTSALPHGIILLQLRCRSRTIRQTFAGAVFTPTTRLPADSLHRIAVRFLPCAQRSGLGRKPPLPELADKAHDLLPSRKMLESLKVRLRASRPKRKAFPAQPTSGSRLTAPTTDRFCRAR